MIGQAHETFSAQEHRETDDDRPRLECGVFGVYEVPDASAVCAEDGVDILLAHQLTAEVGASAEAE